MAIFGTKSYLGIDIGTASVKLVQITKIGERAKLDTYGEIKLATDLEDESLQPTSFKLIDSQIISMISELIKSAGVNAKEVTMSIPIFSSFSTLIELPEMSQRELEKAIPYEARQYVPVPISEVILDWTIVGKVRGGQSEAGLVEPPKIQVLLVAVPKEIVNAYTRIASSANLALKALEIESFALIRSVVGNDLSTICLLDVGHHSTDISIIDQGTLKISHNFDIAGSQITNVLSQAYGVDRSRAAALKEERGLQVAEGEKEMIEVVSPTIDLIINEINQIINDYYKKSGKKIEKLILAGGTANMPGFMEYLAKNLNLSVFRANPFSRLVVPQPLGGILQEIGPMFSVAIGLALREL